MAAVAGEELTAMVRRLPAAPVRVSIPPAAIVWVEPEASVKVSAAATVLVRL